MTYQEFVKTNDVDYTLNLIDEKTLDDIQKSIGLRFGTQLKSYVLNYGYLGYEEIEFYGINSKQKGNSDLIKQTQYLHKYFDKTKNYFAFENVGEGFYILVSENDDMLSYSSEADKIVSLKMKLNDYIIRRLTEHYTVL